MAISNDYVYSYRMERPPEGLDDGSGMVSHVISKLGRISTDPDEPEYWFVVSGREFKSINVPWEEIEEISTGGNIGPDYKAALVRNLNTQNEPISSWGDVQVTELLNQNANADAMAAAARNWIESRPTFNGWPFGFD